jgi:hypothetical protein
MTIRNRWLVAVTCLVVAATTLVSAAHAEASSECGEPPREAIVETGLGRINASGRLSKTDIGVVKKIRRARLVPRCTTRRQEGNTQNLEEVLRMAESIGPYHYFIAQWGGGGLTVRGFVTESTAKKLLSLGGGPFPVDARGLHVVQGG